MSQNTPIDEHTRQKQCGEIVAREVFLEASPIIHEFEDGNPDFRAELEAEMQNWPPHKAEIDLRHEYPEQWQAWHIASNEPNHTLADIVIFLSNASEDELANLSDEEIEDQYNHGVTRSIWKLYERAVDTQDDHESFADWLRDELLYDITDDDAEIYEWYFVSPFLAARLEERGEAVVRNWLGTYNVWGRQTTGQAIKIDDVIESIRQSLGWWD